MEGKILVHDIKSWRGGVGVVHTREKLIIRPARQSRLIYVQTGKRRVTGRAGSTMRKWPLTENVQVHITQ